METKDTTSLLSMIQLDNNLIFIILLTVAMLLFIGFIGASLIVNYKRGTLNSFKEVLRSMFVEPLFWTFMGGSFIAGLNGAYEIMFVAVIAYMGYKLVTTEIIVLTSGDNKYAFFENGTLNKWSSFIISTKTIVALLGIVVLWIAGYAGLYETSIVGERIGQIVAAWAAANGIPLATLLKDKNMSFLNPVKKKEPDMVPERPFGLSVTVPLVASQPESQPEPIPLIPVSQKPPYIPFSPAEWDAMFASYFANNPVVDIDVGKNNAAAAEFIAQGKIVYWAEQLKDYAMWRLDKHLDEFNSDFGFPIEDSEKHWTDKKLLKGCVAYSEDTFLMALPGGLKDVYMRTKTAQDEYNNFASSWNWLGEDKINAVLNRGNYHYDHAYEVMIRRPAQWTDTRPSLPVQP